jgi:hypothetical protein
LPSIILRSQEQYLHQALVVGEAALGLALFGTTSPAELATTVGVLTEVPVMLILVKIANKTKHWSPNGTTKMDVPSVADEEENDCA